MRTPEEWSQGFEIIGDDVIIIAYDSSLQNRNYGPFVKFIANPSLLEGTWVNKDEVDINFIGNICSVKVPNVINPDGSQNLGRSGTRFTYTGTNNSGTIYFAIGYGGVVCPVSYTLNGNNLTLKGDLPDGFYKSFIGEWSKK